MIHGKEQGVRSDCAVTVDINLNQEVLVQLTPEGHRILEDRHEKLEKWAGKKLEHVPPEEDEAGWSSWSLWDLMNTFGKHVFLGIRGSEVPFQDEIKIVLVGTSESSIEEIAS